MFVGFEPGGRGAGRPHLSAVATSALQNLHEQGARWPLPVTMMAERARGPKGDIMVDRKLGELASDIDDASTVVEELQEEQKPAAADEKLNELHATLEQASDTIDDIVDDDERR